MKKIILVLAVIAMISSVKAQEFSVGADVVSSYVWRGVKQAGASIQPSVSLSAGGFSLSAWGSMDIAGNSGGFDVDPVTGTGSLTGGKEVDFTASYEIAGLSLAVTDYWWAGEGAGEYFMYNSHRTNHVFELTLGYTLPIERFPLSLTWNTFFAGSDYYTAKDDHTTTGRSYSSYAALNYPFNVKNISLDASLGLTPWEGAFASSLSVVNIGLKVSKEIKVTDSFSIPIFGQVIANPHDEDIHFVFGISF
jgi:hypothetical protein